MGIELCFQSPSESNSPLTSVGRRSGEDEGYEDALPVLAAHDVEAEAAALLVEDNLPALPGDQRVMSGVLIFSGIQTAN